MSSAFVEAGSFVSQKRLSPADAVRDAAILFPPSHRPYEGAQPLRKLLMIRTEPTSCSLWTSGCTRQFFTKWGNDAAVLARSRRGTGMIEQA